MDDLVVFEAASRKDAAILASFRYAMFRDMHPQEDFSLLEHELIEASQEYYGRKLESRDEYTCVARIGGETVGSGSIMFQERAPHIRRIRNIGAYILSVYVRPERRGKGIATGILKDLLEEAKRRGAFRVGLHASSFGRPVYERLGFAPKDTYLEMEV